MVRNISVNHGLINPLDLYAGYTPVWNLPATLFHCSPVAVLEWKAGRVFILSPVFIPASIRFHLHPPEYESVGIQCLLGMLPQEVFNCNPPCGAAPALD